MTYTDSSLATMLSQRWWLLLLRGLAAIAFGILSWYRPGASAMALVLLFGAYALVDGALHMGMAVSGKRENDHWWLVFLSGLLGVSIGMLTFISPSATLVALVYYVAVWAVATGALQLAAAIRLRKEIHGEWLWVFSGLLSLVLGGWLISQPGLGALSFVWLIATYAVLYGILLVLLAFKVRHWSAARWAD